jgi:diguanylate cyclase (GGDEF)-like protein
METSDDLDAAAAEAAAAAAGHAGGGVAATSTLPAYGAEPQAEAPDDFRTREKTDTMGPPPASVRRRAYVVVLSGPDVGGIYRVSADVPVVIGRGSNAQIRLSDGGVSRQHARIVLSRHRAVLEDLGSHNGTFVGPQRVERCELGEGDLVRIGGRTVLKFRFIDAVEARYQQQLVTAALRDPLTNAFNRRHFDECLLSECAYARRHEQPLSLVFADLDDFKRINDTFGHAAGDAVLKEVARAFEKALRTHDTLFRYGGEEFVILARSTELEGGAHLAERLREQVGRCRFRQLGSDLRVTVSLGVAAFDPGLTGEDMVEKADIGVYEAKRSGKDRVVVVR